ncbi:hypothetical protein [Bacillus spizizenii]|uniref:hypothetical protein n=1 Tax=Bacillus spizizenii TaxID=96241 RepID=UPI002FCA2D34
MTVSDRLATRLLKIPGVTADDIAAWIAEAEAQIGVPEEADDNMLLYLSLSIAYEAIAADAARYFSYVDGEESVDKTNIFENYMKLANEARRQYRKHKRGGTGQFFMNRADSR